jgi:hypothetical protein
LNQSGMVTVPCLVTVAAGVFAPGHLGELTWYLPFELVDDVLDRTGAVQHRTRMLPSRVGMYFVLAMTLFPGIGYLRVWDKMTAASLTLAVLQALLGYVSEARWLRYARKSLRGLFPRLPGQAGCSKRLRKLAATMLWLIRVLARDTSLWADDVWVAGSTPVGMRSRRGDAACVPRLAPAGTIVRAVPAGAWPRGRLPARAGVSAS